MIVQAKGCFYKESDGTRILDGISGCYNLPLGHCSGAETVARRDAEKFSNSYREAWLQNSAERALNSALMGAERRWQFFTVGSEAVEKALMSCWKPGSLELRVGVFQGAFHGKSFATSHLSGYDVPWSCPFTVVHIGRSEPIPENLDVIIYEPVQGGNGFPLHELRGKDIFEYRARTGCLIIADEILCGVWRCGPFSVSCDMDPDVLLLGKGLSGAVPMSAIGYRKEPSAPVVGWTTTHASSSLPLAMMIQLLPVTARAASRRNAQHMTDWTRTFPGALLYASLYFVPSKDPVGAVKRARSAGVVITAASEGFLKIAPSYTMSSGEQELLLTTVENVNENYRPGS